MSFDKRHLAVFLLAGCGSSPLQPTISDKDAPPAPVHSVVAPGVGAAPSAPAATSLSCSRAKGHDVYYAGSTVRLSYTCTDTVSSVLTTSMPSWLTGNGSGTSLVFTGTAPASASKTTWAFSINGEATTGDNAVTTQVITSTTSVALKGTALDLTTHYGFNVDLGFATATLDPLWDGSTDDVTLGVLPGEPGSTDTVAGMNDKAFQSTDTDIPDLKFEETCAGSTGSYVCTATTAAAGKQAVTGGGDLHFAYSPWDQGLYFLNVRPLLTVEGALMRLPALKQTIAVPQAASGIGNVALTHAGNTDAAPALDGYEYTYGLAIGASSSAVAPVVGFTYASQSGSAVNQTFFNRLVMDRTASSASGSPSGIAQATTQLPATTVAGLSDSGFFRLQALADGSWAAVGAATDGSGNMGLYYSHVADSATTPSMAQSTIVSAVMATPAAVLSSDVTAPFADVDGTTRLGLATIVTDGFGGNSLLVGKINPAGTPGTGVGTVVDDADFDLPDGTQFLNGYGPANVDNLAMVADTFNGSPAFYIALRKNQDIQVARLMTVKSAGNYQKVFSNLTSDLTTPHVFSLAAPDGAEHQSLRIAVGKVGAEQVLGVVWRESDANNASGGPNCWFRRIDTTMNTSSSTAPIKLSTGPCMAPQIANDPVTGRFVVVFAEQPSGSATWQIVEREITLVASTADTASTAMVVTSGLAVAPSQLEAAFYPAGNFEAILYREQGTDTPKIHGFHVSPF